jgi:hypothetical protein
VFVETINIQAKQTDHFAQCQEQKYASINDKTFYLIIKIQFIVTEKQQDCFTATI